MGERLRGRNSLKGIFIVLHRRRRKESSLWSGHKTWWSDCRETMGNGSSTRALDLMGTTTKRVPLHRAFPLSKRVIKASTLKKDGEKVFRAKRFIFLKGYLVRVSIIIKICTHDNQWTR